MTKSPSEELNWNFALPHWLSRIQGRNSESATFGRLRTKINKPIVILIKQGGRRNQDLGLFIGCLVIIIALMALTRFWSTAVSCLFLGWTTLCKPLAPQRFSAILSLSSFHAVFWEQKFQRCNKHFVPDI